MPRLTNAKDSIAFDCLLRIGFAEGGDKEEQEFVFTIPKTFFSYRPYVMITTPSSRPVYTSLSIPGYSITINRTISRNNGTDISLSTYIKMVRGDGKQNKNSHRQSIGHRVGVCHRQRLLWRCISIHPFVTTWNNVLCSILQSIYFKFSIICMCFST